VIEHRFRPTYRFGLAFAFPFVALGAGIGFVAVFRDFHSDPGFDLGIAIGVCLFVAAVGAILLLFIVRWYGKVLINSAGVSARDTWGRWRAVPWDSVAGVRRFRVLGSPFVLLSSRQSRWSLWLARSLEPRDALITALVDAGPSAAAVRAQFEIVHHRVSVDRTQPAG
jgi:hypothetical protein